VEVKRVVSFFFFSSSPPLFALMVSHLEGRLKGGFVYSSFASLPSFPAVWVWENRGVSRLIVMFPQEPTRHFLPPLLVLFLLSRPEYVAAPLAISPFFSPLFRPKGLFFFPLFSFEGFSFPFTKFERGTGSFVDGARAFFQFFRLSFSFFPHTFRQGYCKGSPPHPSPPFLFFGLFLFYSAGGGCSVFLSFPLLFLLSFFLSLFPSFFSLRPAADYIT